MEKMVDDKEKRVVILGGGMAGLAVSYFLKQAGIKSSIYEEQNRVGGLCRSFDIDGFIFDYAGHCSFTKNEEIRKIIEKEIKIQKCVSSAVNYDRGIWIKNPAQINLCVLPTDEKISIIRDMIDKQDKGEYANYKEWLDAKYGNCFSEKYPCKYTRKYWTTDAENLEIEWIGPRMYVPTIEEVLYGAFEKDTKSVHYSGEIRYPADGGFERFTRNLCGFADITECGKKVTEINYSEKSITLNNHKKVNYDYLVSTLPLDSMKDVLWNVPNDIYYACEQLKHTSLLLVSLGLRGSLKVPEGFYIYDEELTTVRGYSTSMFGKGSAPEGYCTLQLETYFSEYKPIEQPIENIKEKMINECINMGIFKREDIIVSKVDYLEYANVIFSKGVYRHRKRIHDFMRKNNIYYAGRFADWEYMWVDQTIMSAKKMAEELIERIHQDA